MDSFIIFHMKGEDIYKKIFSNPSTNLKKKNSTLSVKARHRKLGALMEAKVF